MAHADTAAELSNLNYKYEGHPGIRQWVEDFVTRSGLSGQVGFCLCVCTHVCCSQQQSMLEVVGR